MRTAESTLADRLRMRPTTKQLADCERVQAAGTRRLTLRMPSGIDPSA